MKGTGMQMRLGALTIALAVCAVGCGVTAADILDDSPPDAAAEASSVGDSGKPRVDGSIPDGKGVSTDAVTKDHQAPSDVRGGGDASDAGSSGDAVATKDGGTDAASRDGGHDAGETDSGHETDGSTRDGEGEKDAAEVDAGKDAGEGMLTALPATLAFGMAGGTPGFAACGTTAANETFTVKNVGTAATTWWAALSLGAGSPYALSPVCTKAAPCSIAAGASAVVTVTPSAVPAQGGITTFDDTVTVVSSVPGDLGHTVQLSETSYGAVLTFSPTDQNFGTQPNTGKYTSPSLQILNAGNASVSASLTPAGSGQFTLSTGSVMVPAMGGASFTATYNPAGSTAPVAGTVALSQVSPTCAPLPSPLTLEGQGTVAMISVPGVLNFNAGQNGGVGVSCGSTASPMNVVVSNAGTGSASVVTASFARGGAFTVTTALPLTVPAGGSANLQVTPAAIPASSPPGAILDDVLTITTNASMDSPHHVAVQETTAGAVLTLSLPTSGADSVLAFSTTPRGNVASYPFTVTNSGNVPTLVTPSSGSALVSFGAAFTAGANVNTSATGTFSPTASGTTTTTGSLVVPNGTPLCSSFSGTIPLSITGTATGNNTYTVSPAHLSFGANACGASGAKGTPPAAETVTLTNTGGGTTWAATLTGPGASLFTLSATSGNLPGDFLFVPGSTSFTVTPVALGSLSGLSAAEVEFGVFATLTVAVGTNGGMETFTLPITEVPSGAFAEWDRAQVTVLEGSPSASFALLNVSSYGASFDLASGSLAFGLSTTVGPASNGSPLTSSVTDTAGAPASTSVTASLASAATQLCGPLPAPLPIVGK